MPEEQEKMHKGLFCTGRKALGTLIECYHESRLSPCIASNIDALSPLRPTYLGLRELAEFCGMPGPLDGFIQIEEKEEINLEYFCGVLQSGSSESANDIFNHTDVFCVPDDT
ncbi:hypothetical protein WISP_137523 [Willisornis vidua]|uniref:Uncharacterized protein n=1 Tax=Willisornis vidua TaxID=1566151 RepID=A0ABQ9CMX7_9PASS|nr:hypothetical protein WISP_137523 [Willisornis vidua]